MIDFKSNVRLPMDEGFRKKVEDLVIKKVMRIETEN